MAVEAALDLVAYELENADSAKKFLRSVGLDHLTGVLERGARASAASSGERDGSVGIADTDSTISDEHLYLAGASEGDIKKLNGSPAEWWYLTGE